MTVLLTLVVLTGSVTYYNPGIMAEVYQNRLAWEQVAPCQDCLGYLAVEDCTQIGNWAYVVRLKHVVAGPYLVTDCGKFHTKGRIAEVDYQTAVNWQMLNGPLDDVRIVILDWDG